ncbi:MAG: sialidase family protein [Thermoguttaceae bacterium]
MRANWTGLCINLPVLALMPLIVTGVALADTDQDINWLATYKGGALPASPQWTWHGDKDVWPEIVNGTLRLADVSGTGLAHYRTTWEARPDQEIIVEAEIRVGYMSAGDWKAARIRVPGYSGSPIGILVCDGQHQEGLMLCDGLIGNFEDRFHLMKTTDAFHVYRLVIRGTDMQVYVDGQLKIRGKDAFWRPATEPKPFLQFGSNATWKAREHYTGEAYWEYIKVGVRPVTTPPAKPELKITLSKPWTIPSNIGRPQNRPYLYNVGRGLLLMSVAQGPDKEFEPYGILKSTDEGKTWSPIEGLQRKMFAPQPMIRLADGNILGASRWSKWYNDPYYKDVYAVGMTYLFDPSATSFKMYEHKILLPAEAKDAGAFDRHIFDVGGGKILAVVYGASPYGYLMQTTDEGKSWTHFSTIGKGDEPGVARITPQDWTALLRQDSWAPLHQVWSHDGGKTWSQPAVLEEGSVDPDVLVMSNGVLACSYGRPGDSLMLSTDHGKTWGYHQVITDMDVGGYTTIQEVRPGRLLYVYGVLTALHIDVEMLH